MRLDRLILLHAATPVSVCGLAGGEQVLRATVVLWDLLAALSRGPGRGWASTIDFTFRPVSLPEGRQDTVSLLLAPPAGLPVPHCVPPLALHLNGRLCWADGWPEGVLQRQEVPTQHRVAPPEPGSLQPGRAEPPAVAVPRPMSVSASQTFHVRLIVHRIDDIEQLGELFPDVYVKARMAHPRGAWCRTDVHVKAVQATALFEYRLVLAPFSLPPSPVQAGRSGRVERLPPTLEVVMMDQDRVTRDDRLGGITLSLQDLPLPEDDGHGCGVASLSVEKVNLFDAAAVRGFRRRGAVFPREVAGHWPLLKEKKMNREVKAVGSIRLTVQLLTAREAARCPAAQGNKAWPLNRYPPLARPRRQHGRVRDMVVLGVVDQVQLVVARATGLSLRAFIVVVLAAVYLKKKVKKRHVETVAVAGYSLVQHCLHDPPCQALLLLCCCALCCLTWRLTTQR